MPDDSLIDHDLSARLFNPATGQVPLGLPGAASRAQSRDRYEGNPPGTNAPPTYSPEQQARINEILTAIAQFSRNTQITAAAPAHQEPMFWSNPIDLSASYVLAAAAGDYQTVLDYTCPPSRGARIQWYGYDIANFAYDGSISWRFLKNGQPVPSLEGFTQHRGSMVQPSRTFIVLTQKDTLQFQVKRVTAADGTTTIAMKFGGWDWQTRKDYDGTKSSITAF